MSGTLKSWMSRIVGFVLGAVLINAGAAADAASMAPAAIDRVAEIRTRLLAADGTRRAGVDAAEGQRDGDVGPVAQWFNWGNFPNFPNWPNWQNWPNWRNF